MIDDGTRWKAGGDPCIFGTPLMHLSAGCATQGNGNARKAVQQNPLGLEPSRNRRARAGTANENISHAQLLLIRSDARAFRPSIGIGTISGTRARAATYQFQSKQRLPKLIRRQGEERVQQNFLKQWITLPGLLPSLRGRMRSRCCAHVVKPMLVIKQSSIHHKESRAR